MPNTKSALKRLGQNERRRLRNRYYTSRARNFVKKVRRALKDGELEAAQEAFVQASGALDRAAEKGILPRNNAARRKSRLARQLHEARAAQAR